jgi:protein-tyrosine phosphatase
MPLRLPDSERYEQFQRKKDVWKEMIDLPLTLQMNAGPFIRGGHGRRLCLRMLNEYSNCILGSDCHNLTDRSPNLEEARGIIEKKAGRDRLTLMDKYTEDLLGG